MKQHKLLLGLLSFIFFVGMLLQILIIVITAVGNIFIEEQEILIHEEESGSKTYLTPPSFARDGFPIPVNLSAGVFDTIYTLEGFRKGLSKKHRTYSTISRKSWTRYKGETFEDDFGKQLRESFDTLFKIDTSVFEFIATPEKHTYKDTTYINAPFDIWLQRDRENSPFEVTGQVANVKTSINIKPANRIQFYILLLRFYLFSLFSIFIFYQLFRAVKRLNKTLSFSDNLAKRVKNIGIALIIYAIIRTLISYEISRWYGGIRLRSAQKIHEIVQAVTIRILGQIEFEPYFLITGLLLIVLSTLMKKALKIEEDWSLTI